MSDLEADPHTAYVAAAAALTALPLSAQQIGDAAVVMQRLAAFAADVRAFALADEIEIAGTFTP